MKNKQPRKLKLYQNHPVYGRIPNWKQVWRCESCAHIYPARPLVPRIVDEMQTNDDRLMPYPSRTMHIPYACCPRCHAFQVAEFSTS